LYSPIPTRPSPSLPGLPGSLSVRDPLEAAYSWEENDAEAILGTLRGAVSAGGSELGAILTAITEAARTLTAASGAALALRQDEIVVCCARSGETAPELGAHLSEDSGISGECLRTGKTLRCDDTQKDYRVDPEVCRRLGLRSIAVVPLRGRQRTIGILEVFSPRAYAFSQEPMNLLVRLAELAEAAQLGHGAPARGQGAAAQPASARPPEPANFIPAATPVAAADETALSRLAAGLHTQREKLGQNRRRTLRLVLPVLALISLVGWRILTKPQPVAAPVSQARLSSVPAAEDPAPVPSAEVVGTLSPESARVPAGTSEVDLVSGPVARTEVPDVVRHLENPATRAGAIAVPAADRSHEPTSTGPTRDSMEEPPIAAPVSDSSNLGSLLAAPTRMPTFGAPVSRGISEGALERKVNPRYPVQALALRIAGSVVLNATNGEDGRVRELKVVSGHPVLARAAMEAVGQWRYRPYLLNGKPVTMEEQITVSFRAP
jgi:TonB family protein